MGLVLEQSGVKPGKDFWIGWQIIRNPGWHTYWKHPGDVGVPPTLEWDLPKGFSNYPMLYFPPEKVKMANIRANGNYGETLFLTKIIAPKDLIKGDTITLRAKASWLTCSRQCLPGYTDLSITLDVVDAYELDPEWYPKFEKVRNLQAKPFGDEWKISASEKGSRIDLRIENANHLSTKTGRPIFFCSNRLIRSDGKQIFKKEGNSLHLRMERSEWANKKEGFLSGLIYREDGWGDGISGSYRSINAPLLKSKF